MTRTGSMNVGRGRMLVMLMRAAVMVAALLVANLAPLGGGAAQEQKSDQEQEARELLTQAAETMAAVSSFHFQLTTEGGTTKIMDEVEVGAVEGDVVRPDRFRATVTAKLAFITLDLDVVGIGDRLWVTDPTSREGGMLEMTIVDGEGPPLADILNPDRLLLQAVDLIEDPKVAGTEEIDGVDTTRVEGTFDPSRLDIATPVPEMLVLDPKPVAIWIDGEGRVVRLRVEGPLTDVEDPDIVRTLHLTEFGEEVEITPPAGA